MKTNKYSIADVLVSKERVHLKNKMRTLVAEN